MIHEVDIDALKSVFHFLKQQYRNVYLNPDEKFYDLYISPQEENIILKRLYVDAPRNRINENYHIPKLEQLLVDLIINDPMILPIGASEVKKIIANARDKYNLNYSTIQRYAKKRRVEKALVPFGLSEKESLWQIKETRWFPLKIKFLFYIMLLIVSGFSFLGKSSIVYKNKLVLFLACTSIVSLMAVDYVNAITNMLGSNAKKFEPILWS